jgi:hypothetical protein
MAHHRRLIFRKRGVSICVVEVPVGVSASEAIGEAPKRWRCVFQERAGYSPVDHRTFLGAANCGYRSAGSNEGKDRWASLDNGQRSAVVCGPRKFGKTAHREAVAFTVIHANNGLSSGHISLSSVAPDIS